jgi:hypothetical protein
VCGAPCSPLTRLKVTKAVDRISPLDPMDSDFAAAETSIICGAVRRATASLILVQCPLFSSGDAPESYESSRSLDPISDFAAAETSIICGAVRRATASLILVQCAVHLNFVLRSPA